MINSVTPFCHFSSYQVVKAFIHRAHWWPAYYFTLPSSILEVESFSENAGIFFMSILDFAQ